MVNKLLYWSGWIAAAVLSAVLAVTSLPAKADSAEAAKSEEIKSSSGWFDVGYIYSALQDKYYLIKRRYHELMDERTVPETKIEVLDAPTPEISTELPDSNVTIEPLSDGGKANTETM